jgi:peptidyl-prolyl cis-trans isomerase D
MLEKVRENASGWMVKTILWVLVFAFVGTIFLVWGYGDNQGKRPVAKVRGQVITVAEYRKRIDRLKKQMKQMADSLPPGFFEGKELEKRVMQDMILDKLQTQSAQKLGLNVSDIEISAEVTADPSFHNNGAFDKNVYYAVMRNNRLTPTQYENLLRTDIATGKLVKSITDSVEVTDKEISDHFNSNYDLINLKYAELSPADFKDRVKLTQEQVEGFYEKNRFRFQQQEQRQVEYLYADPKKMAGDMEISQGTIEKYYERHMEEFNRQEQFIASHIIVMVPEGAAPENEAELRQKTEGYLKEIRGGAKFADMARKHSEGPSAPHGGSLGSFGAGMMDPVFENALRELKPGEVSGIIKTKFGFHIILLEGHIKGGYEDIKSATPKIKDKIRANKGESFAKTAINRILKNRSGGDAGWQTLAGENRLEYKRATLEVGKKLDIGDDWNKVVKRAFSMKKGDTSSPMLLNNGYYSLRLVEITLPHPLPLESVRGVIENALTKRESSNLAKKSAQALYGIMRDDKVDLKTAAKRMNLTVKESGYFNKKSLVKGIPSNEDFEKAAYSNRAGESVIISSADKEYVIEILDRKPAEQKLFADKKNEIRDELLIDKRFDAIAKWRDSLLSAAERENAIEIDPLYN